MIEKIRRFVDAWRQMATPSKTMPSKSRDRIPELRVKIRSLADEARVIRGEERRQRRRWRSSQAEQVLADARFVCRAVGHAEGADRADVMRDARAQAARIRVEHREAVGEQAIRDAMGRHKTMREHRVVTLRTESRHALLAYAFLRGRPYAGCEDPERTRDLPHPQKIQQIANRFGARSDHGLDEIIDWIAAAWESEEIGEDSGAAG